jgi:DNA-binding PadR family transcriptional regulator
MHRGDAKVLVLDELRKKPMHGYEIAKGISETFGGVYEPSPGMIYPTLQYLEDIGYVTASHESGKKVYSITKNGRAFLRENDVTINRIHKFFERANGKMDAVRSGMELRKNMMMRLPEMTPEQAKKVAAILKDAKSKIERIE